MFDRRLKIGVFSLIFTLGIIGGASLVTSEIASAQSEGGNGIFLPIISNMVAEDVSTDPISIADRIDIQEILLDEGGSTGDDDLSALGAYGREFWSGSSITIGGTTIPTSGGMLDRWLKGDDDFVEKEVVAYTAIGNLCDTSISFTYGNGSRRYNGSVSSGCSPVRRWEYRFYMHQPVGSACAELWAENWNKLIATQCHYIHSGAPAPTPRPAPRPDSNSSSSDICSSRPTLQHKDGYERYGGVYYGLAWKQNDVKDLQRLLTAKGFPTAVDGYFGTGTRDKVKEFQSHHRLTVDGIVGYYTWSKLCQ